jgi:uncharacterized membrane protein required for colicin V production
MQKLSEISTSLDNLPIGAFDLILVIVLAVGIQRGRKHGMSVECVNLLKWLAILFGCALVYQPVGQLMAQSTSMLGTLSGYILGYLVVAALIYSGFAVVKRSLGGKLLGSDIFGRSEYYLGMGSGLVRATCILLVVLAVLNARYYSPMEVRAMQKFQDDVYGSNYFPTWQTLQSTVFEKSITGPWIKDHLGFLLIKPTQPGATQEFHQKEYQFP